MYKKKLTGAVTAVDEIRGLAKIEQQLSEVRKRTDEKGNPVFPTSEYFDAVELLLIAYDPRALPFAQRAMEDLRKTFDAWTNLEDEDYPDYTHSWSVAMQYWQARDAAQAALFRETPKAQSPQSPTSLKAEGVSDRQIARIWRWYDEFTEQPDDDRVRRELAKPGSEMTAAEIKKHEHLDLVRRGFIYVEPAEPEVPA